MTTLTRHFPAGSDLEEESQTLLLAFEGEDLVEEEAAADEALREVVPPPVNDDGAFQELEETSRGHRVLILKGGAVIAVSTLVAIGGALLFHFLFAGAFIAATLWGHNATGKGIGGGDSPDEGGRGYMLIDDAPAAAAAGGTAQGAGKAAEALPSSPVLPPPEQLPALPEVVSPPVAVAPLPAVTPPVVVPADLGTVKAVPPTQAVVTPPPDVVIAPPTPAPQPAVANPTQTPSPAQVAQGGSKSAIPNAVGKGKGKSLDGDEFGDEAEIAMFKPGKGSGRGDGRGSGVGNGFDRGLSAANAGAQILENPVPPLPFHLQAKRPSRNLVMKVHIEADGTVSAVDIAQSSGIDEIDEFFRNAFLANAKVRPQVRDGKPIASIIDFGVNFFENDK